MISRNLNGKHLILASQSPRRQFLLKELGFDFDILEPNVNEVFPEGMRPEKIAIFLAELKAGTIDVNLLDDNTIVITADTIVYIGNEVLGKPINYNEAVLMLQKLSGKKHDVILSLIHISEPTRPY